MIKELFNKAKSGTLEFFAHYFFGKAIDKAADEVVDKVVKKPLESHLFGIGTNDETLAFHAYAIAATKLGAKPAGLKRVGNVFESLSAEERKKVIEIIGNREDTLTEKTTVTKKGKKAAPAAQGTNQKTAATNDEVTVSEKSETKNIKGAEIILALSKLKTEDEIRLILKGFGALDTTSVYIKDIWEKGNKAAKIIWEKAGGILEEAVIILGKIEDATGAVSTLNDLAGDINRKFFDNVPQPGQPVTPPTTNVGKWQSAKNFFKDIQDKLLDTLY